MRKNNSADPAFRGLITNSVSNGTHILNGAPDPTLVTFQQSINFF
jgi:hypothetical protein